MKIAIVSGHFMPELGYQEVYLARTYSRLGHQVRVFTSTSISPSGKKIIKNEYKFGLFRNSKYGYEILRLKTTFKLSFNVFSYGLKRSILDYMPDTIIIIGLSKMFPISLLSVEITNKANLVAIFGDEYEHKERSLSFLKEIGFHIFKKRLYRRSVELCKRIILNLPETETIFLSYLKKNERSIFLNKKVHLSLGYDPDEFYFDENGQKNIRRNLNILTDEIVFITSTRINSRKRIENVVDIISKMYSEGKKVRYIIIGFLGDHYEQILKDYIEKQVNPDIFYCYSFLSHEEIRKYYCASDIGIWLTSAISIQEAMGTGLPVILENKPSLNHLVTEGVSGWYFKKGQLYKTIENSVMEIKKMGSEDRIAYRNKVTKINWEKLSYDKIAEKIISNL